VTRTDRTKRIDPVRADSYAEVGRRLLHAGRTMADHGDRQHASALAILAVHAVIAYVDAVTIHAGGRKSTSADHAALGKLLRETLGNRLPDAQGKLIARVVSEKDQFEYQGYVASWAEASVILQRAERVGVWVEEVLTTLPRRAS